MSDFNFMQYLRNMAAAQPPPKPMQGAPDSLGVPGGVADGPTAADKAAATQKGQSAPSGGAMPMSAVTSPSYWTPTNPFMPKSAMGPGMGGMGQSGKGGGAGGTAGVTKPLLSAGGPSKGGASAAGGG